MQRHDAATQTPPCVGACVTPTPPSQSLLLPPELLLEIVALSDAATLIRCAAASKFLRHDILSPPFLRRVCHHRPDAIVPRSIVGFLHRKHDDDDDPASPCFSLAHPATPAAASLVEHRLAPFMSRVAADVLDEYEPVASRGGLVALRRRDPNWRRRSQRRSDICVYNPVTGDRSFLPDPRNSRRKTCYMMEAYSYLLLTAADGIPCSFRLLAVHFSRRYDDCDKTLTVSSDGGGKWSYVTWATCHPEEFRWCELDSLGQPVVLGGVVHWLIYTDDARSAVTRHILTYDVGTAARGFIQLPTDHRLLPRRRRTIHLGSSPEGSLRLLVLVKLSVSVWLLSAGGWTKHAVIATESRLRSLYPSWSGCAMDLDFETRCCGVPWTLRPKQLAQ